MTMKQRNKARAITFVYSFQPVYRYPTVVYGPLYWKKFTSSRRELGPFSPLDSVAFLVRCGKSQNRLGLCQGGFFLLRQSDSSAYQRPANLQSDAL